MSGISYMTPEGYEKLNSDLEELKTKGRDNVAKAIAEAREKGDLSENAEYHAAREAQSHNETDILKMKEILESYELVQEPSDKDSITISSNVKIKYLDTNEIEVVSIVTKIESDPLNNMISNESPIGSALMGKKKGNKIDVISPNGIVHLEVLEIL